MLNKMIMICLLIICLFLLSSCLVNKDKHSYLVEAYYQYGNSFSVYISDETGTAEEEAIVKFNGFQIDHQFDGFYYAKETTPATDSTMTLTVDFGLEHIEGTVTIIKEDLEISSPLHNANLDAESDITVTWNQLVSQPDLIELSYYQPIDLKEGVNPKTIIQLPSTSNTYTIPANSMNSYGSTIIGVSAKNIALPSGALDKDSYFISYSSNYVTINIE